MIAFTLNGQPKTVERLTTIEEILQSSGIPTRFCAVERNQEIVPKTEYSSVIIQEGDAIEVVTLVGGG